MPDILYGRYEALRILGRGAMAVVYLARDLEDGRIVALKAINAKAATDNPVESIDYEKRMEREAELSRKLNHPNIVGFHDAGYENGTIAYLALEFIDGESLEELMKRENQVSLVTVYRVTADILAALGHAHARGIVHRDLKPANVLLTHDRRAKLADFGIARPEESTLTVAGQRLGTPLYTAPENITGVQVTPRSDLFSLGVVVYEMIAGQRPFTGRNMQEVLVAVVMKSPAPLESLRPGIAPEWQLFVSKLLEKKPEDRYQSAEEALAAMETTLAPPTPTIERALPLEVAPTALPAEPEAVPPPPVAAQPAPSRPAPGPVVAETKPAYAPAKPSFWDRIRNLFK
ncbi:MAG: serine/threonine-protein kinase [Thermoanaerobaculia bacterium]